MRSNLTIRLATPDDHPQIHRAIIELQDYERLQHATRLPGAQVADAYLDWMLHQIEASGAMLVAEDDDGFIGFVAGWIETAENIAETPDCNRYGYISDICVMPAFRGQRIAKQLLDGIEAHLRRAGVARIRINALAVNRSAQASYERAGFTPYEILYENLAGCEEHA